MFQEKQDFHFTNNNLQIQGFKLLQLESTITTLRSERLPLSKVLPVVAKMEEKDLAEAMFMMLETEGQEDLDIDGGIQKTDGAVVAGVYGGFYGDHRGGRLQEQDMFSLR